MEAIEKLLDRVKRDFGVQLQKKDAAPIFSQDALIGDPNCPICNGIGFISYDAPIGDPLFGKITPCECRKTAIETDKRHLMTAESNLTGYQNMRFETFQVEGRGHLRPDEKASLEYAFAHAQKFANQREGWLLLMGSYGTGKTHLAAAISNTALDDGIPNIFLPVPDLLDSIRASYNDTEQDYTNRFDLIRSIPLLILDDLGSQSSTPWAMEKLYQILNHRYVNRLATVITTNARLQDLDGRIASRLEDPSLVTRITLQVPDYRKPMKATNESEDLSSLHQLFNRTFETFEARSRENLADDAAAQLAEAYKHAFAFAQKPEGWLLFSGPNGIGKTHLAAAIGNYRQARQDHPLFVSAANLLDHLRAAFSPTSTIPYDVVFEKIRNAPILILDHLNTANATPWAKEKLFQILDHRYLAPLPTVITTTLAVQDLDASIRSRVIDFKICRVLQMFEVPMYSRNPNITVLPGRTKRGFSSRNSK